MQRFLALAAIPWVGVFHLSITGGSEDVQWTLHHQDAGACDVSANGSGSETGQLTPGAPVVVPLTGAGTTAFLAPATGLKATAVLDREGSVTYGADDGDDGEGCPSGGDGDMPPAPDCGIRSLPLTFTFQPGVPPGLSAESGGTDDRYKNCAVNGTVLPAVPTNLSAPLLADGIGPEPGPPFTALELTGTDMQADSDIDATSKLTVDLKLERVAAVAALDLKDAYTTAPVDAQGRARLPVTCPKGRACSGTIAIAAGDFGAEQLRAVKQPDWPRPLIRNEPALGSARFTLKAGRKARITLRLAHGSKQALRPLAGEPLDVIVRQSPGGKHKPLAFVAGQVRLKLS